MSKIVILKQLKDKYYVEKCDNPNEQYMKHMNGELCEWTKKYKPYAIERIIESDKYDINFITKQYMKKYGIDNVRGGNYNELELTESVKINLKYELFDDAYDDDFYGICERCSKEFSNKRIYKKHMNICKEKPKENKIIINLSKCSRCGRLGHILSDCYAKTTLSGEKLDDD